jgi:uncharacterized protein YgbK (DUF1537 family)
MTIRMAYYGDDFTGSTDALEQLVRGGLPTVLFTQPSTAGDAASSSEWRAAGIAGQARAMSPAQLEAALPLALEALAALGPQFVHYKVCSTFDSAPAVGSIGRAIDVGARCFQNRLTPLVVGAPSLGRYCVFGNLFARSGLDSPLYRLDRHPTMSRHPATPMDEADLRLHLARQTDRPIELVDVLTLDQEPTALFNRLAACPEGAIVLLDVLTNRHLATIGAALVELQRREAKPMFVVGSSGVDAALVNRWRELGQLQPRELGPPRPVDRLLAVSGSCSPVTDRQIAWAVARGFAEISLDVPELLASSLPEPELEAIAKRIQTEQDQGRSVIMHTGGLTTSAAAAERLARRDPSQPTLGDLLGRIVRAALRRRRWPRVAIAGGDTSGDVARALGIESLELAAPHAPGAPLCRARSPAPEVDGVEFAFKGGQVGHDNYFESLLHGA